MTPSLAPAVSTAAPESPATKRHRAVLTNLLLARSLNASPRQRTESAYFQALSMGGTGLEPVTPSLSILSMELPRLTDTHETAWLSGFWPVGYVLAGVGWCAKAKPC
jgi:hypothetical protein